MEELALVLNVATAAIAVITVVVAFYLIKFFKGTPFEGPWKMLFLVPILMAGTGICEMLGVRVGHILCSTTVLVFLYSLYSFYRVWQRIRAIEVLKPEGE